MILKVKRMILKLMLNLVETELLHVLHHHLIVFVFFCRGDKVNCESGPRAGSRLPVFRPGD